MKQIEEMLKRFFKNSFLKHLSFIASFLLLFTLPAVFSLGFVPNIYRISLYGFFLLICIYSGRWCTARWFLKRVYSKFILYSLMLIMILIILGILGLNLLVHNNIVMVSVITSFFVLIFFSLGIFISIVQYTVVKQLLEKDIERQHRESELQFLRSQLNPHFIFNVLNNLYGLSFTAPDKMPGLLLKLSNLLRYSVYSAKENLVPLVEELEYITNYIELEKTRFGESLNLVTNINNFSLNHFHIPPMLLIVFVENAFKHSRNSSESNISINIDLQVFDNTLFFIVKNSLGAEVKDHNEIENSGVGISTTLKRLELLYPGKYFFEQTKTNNFYQITLKILLNETI